MRELTRILSTDPTLITFIYGPINSGKTELITNLIENLPKSQKVFYINLRGRFISNYDEFIKVLFDVEHEARYERIKEFLKPVVNVLPESYSGIPIPKDMFLKLFKEKEVEDAFVYIETILRAFYKDGSPPVLVIDELQVIGDLKVNDLLIYKLFNFFIRLTKELHLAHVFAISSDSLFIEDIHSEAMLEDRCRYILVDDFDRETTIAFLENYGLNEEEKELAWHYCGGKPICLVELINAQEREQMIKGMLTLRTGEIRQRIKVLTIVKKKILFEGE
ncbi:MAG: ATP-binding protein, partial [Methanosarcinales archaeon]|nr:ATP-binding protein [Methanosarcinales archaeon]